VTLADKIRPEDRRLDPSRTAPELARRVRALAPHVGAFLELPDGGRLGVRQAALAEAPDAAAGELRREGGRLLVACAQGALELLEVQPEGGRPMPAADFLRGRGAAYGVAG